jgi:uracil permease
MNNLKYDIRDVPKKWYEWIIFTLQQVLAVFVATTLIANICGTPISSCLLGACFGTLIYQVITKFRSPMFISSCGATVSAVCGALALNAAGNNYLMVFCGGLIIMAIYALFALIIKLTGTSFMSKIFPPAIVGSVTIVIGLNLAKFILTYVSVGGEVKSYTVLIAIFTMLITAIVSKYGKGFIKNIPFLFGIVGGYLLSLLLTLTTDLDIVNFESFSNMQWYPDLTFLQWSSSDWSFANLGRTALFFVPVGICALLEHYSDHKVLSNIIGTDLTENPGLHKTLLGDGVASAVGTAVCGLPNTSYGESIATTGFSRVASVWIVTAAAVTLGIMSFIAPITAFVQSIPTCVFGGCAMILYGYIAASGLKTIINNKVDLEDNRNLIIVSVILTVGVSGIFLFDNAFAGVSLAMVLGVILNLVLRKNKNKDKLN